MNLTIYIRAKIFFFFRESGGKRQVGRRGPCNGKRELQLIYTKERPPTNT